VNDNICAQILDAFPFGLANVEITVERVQYLTEDFEELHDVDDPGTETRRSLRLGSNEIRVEFFVVQVRLNGFLAHLGNVFLVVVYQRRQEIVNLITYQSWI